MLSAAGGIEPSLSSAHVAPASLYASPASRDTDCWPIIVITGAVTSASAGPEAVVRTSSGESGTSVP